MGNPFIEKDERKKKNPFIEKAIQSRAKQIAQTNYQKLLELFNSYGPNDNQKTRERIRLRVVEAKDALDACG